MLRAETSAGFLSAAVGRPAVPAARRVTLEIERSDSVGTSDLL